MLSLIGNKRRADKDGKTSFVRSFRWSVSGIADLFRQSVPNALEPISQALGSRLLSAWWRTAKRLDNRREGALTIRGMGYGCPCRRLSQLALVDSCHGLLVLVLQLQQIGFALVDHRYFYEVFYHADFTTL